MSAGISRESVQQYMFCQIQTFLRRRENFSKSKNLHLSFESKRFERSCLLGGGSYFKHFWMDVEFTIIGKNSLLTVKVYRVGIK